MDSVLATRLSKRFAERLVLQDLSFHIGEGSSVALFGGSQSGKTTLLRLLAGLESVSSGSLVVFGQRLEALNDTERAKYRREKVGFLSPDVPWLSQLSLRDNVALPLLLAHTKRCDIEPRVAELCDSLELREAESFSALALLERYRWLLARALVHRPKLLLVDDVEALKDEAETFIESLLRTSLHVETTLVFTTQQPRMAAYAEHIFTLRGSKLHLTRGDDVGVAEVCGN